jgi:hypothetical protein
MPRLRCEVNSCAHNTEACCSLGAVNVEGRQATSASASCCGSFSEVGSATNCGCGPNQAPEVSCGACNCDHNHNHQCCADSIDITGVGASNASQTQCSSFCSSAKVNGANYDDYNGDPF